MLLGIVTPSRPMKTYHGRTLRDLVTANILPAGTPLVFTSGKRDLANAVVAANGEIELNGQTY